jgi:hypothetical protein
MGGKMNHLEVEIQTIIEQCQMGNITVEERNYLIQEIRDVRAAQECAGDEQTFRYVVQLCNVALAAV